MPNTLIVNLQRICFDFDKMGNIKLNNRIEFPTVLDLKDYTLSEVMTDINKQFKPKKPDV
jgi:hypothetical protein